MFSPNGAPEPKRTLGAQWCYKRAREYACGDFFFFEKKVFWKKYKHASTILRLRSRRPSSQPRTFAS